MHLSIVLFLAALALVCQGCQQPALPSATASAALAATTPTVPASAAALADRYKQRVVHCCPPSFPNCDVYLCGTLHVAKTSSELVRDVIQSVKPDFVVLELCESRIDSLYELDIDENAFANVTLVEVVKTAIRERSGKTLGMGLLTWVQVKAAKVMGSKLGGELSIAAKEGATHRAIIVLGDRLYGVTIQRIMDRLRLLEKIKMAGLLFWEVLTMSVFKLKEYIVKSETDDAFIRDEVERFGRYLPTVADVIVSERDEYLAQTLLEIARVGFVRTSEAVKGPTDDQVRRGKIVAVVGAAHLAGVQRWLQQGGVSDARMAEISSSSRHNATWPGGGMLQVVNTQALFGASNP